MDVIVHPSAAKLHIHGLLALILACAGLWAVLSVYYLNPVEKRPELFLFMAGFFAFYAVATTWLANRKAYVIGNKSLEETPWVFGQIKKIGLGHITSVKERRDLLDLVLGTASVEIEIDAGKKLKRAIGMLRLKDARKLVQIVKKGG